MVLLKNDRGALPLTGAVGSIAVIGADADTVVAGGGSSLVKPTYTVSPLQGIQDRVGRGRGSATSPVPTPSRPRRSSRVRTRSRRTSSPRRSATGRVCARSTSPRRTSRARRSPTAPTRTRRSTPGSSCSRASTRQSPHFPVQTRDMGASIRWTGQLTAPVDGHLRAGGDHDGQRRGLPRRRGRARRPPRPAIGADDHHRRRGPRGGRRARPPGRVRQQRPRRDRCGCGVPARLDHPGGRRRTAGARGGRPRRAARRPLSWSCATTPARAATSRTSTCRTARSSSSARSPRRTRARSSCSSPVRVSRPPTGRPASRRSCTRGSAARSRATRSRGILFGDVNPSGTAARHDPRRRGEHPDQLARAVSG